MRILTIGFDDEFVKQLEVELANTSFALLTVQKICMMQQTSQTLDTMNLLLL